MALTPPGALKLVGRGFLVLWLLAAGATTIAVVLPFVTRTTRDRIIRSWSRMMLLVLNVRLHAQGATPASTAPAAMFIANHVSWIDILAINAVHPVRFVAKAEIRDWPLIGWMVGRTGNFFLRRESRESFVQVNERIKEALGHGACVAMFPEGTTTDGTGLRPFYTGLMQSAIESRACLRPVALRYRDARGTRTTAAAFVGDESLLGSILRLLAQGTVHLELTFIQPISVRDQTRRELAAQAQDAIASSLNLAIIHSKGERDGTEVFLLGGLPTGS